MPNWTQWVDDPELRGAGRFASADGTLSPLLPGSHPDVAYLRDRLAATPAPEPLAHVSFSAAERAAAPATVADYAPPPPKPEEMPFVGPQQTQDEIQEYARKLAAEQYAVESDKSLDQILSAGMIAQRPVAGGPRPIGATVQSTSTMGVASNPAAEKSRAEEQARALQEAESAAAERKARRAAVEGEVAGISARESENAARLQSDIEKSNAIIEKGIQPKDWTGIVQNKSIAGKVATAVAMIMGGVSQGLLGSKENPAITALRAAADEANAIGRAKIEAAQMGEAQKRKLYELSSKNNHAQIELALRKLQSGAADDADSAAIEKLRREFAAQNQAAIEQRGKTVTSTQTTTQTPIYAGRAQLSGSMPAPARQTVPLVAPESRMDAATFEALNPEMQKEAIARGYYEPPPPPPPAPKPVTGKAPTPQAKAQSVGGMPIAGTGLRQVGERHYVGKTSKEFDAALEKADKYWTETRKRWIPGVGFVQAESKPEDISAIREQFDGIDQAINSVEQIATHQAGTGESVIGTGRRAAYISQSNLLKTQIGKVLGLRQMTMEEIQTALGISGDPNSITDEWLNTNRDKVANFGRFLKGRKSQLIRNFGIEPGRVLPSQNINGRIYTPIELEPSGGAQKAPAGFRRAEEE